MTATQQPYNLTLLDAIKATGKSGAAICREIGIKPETLSRIINHRRTPQARTLALLCRRLNCQPADLGFEVAQ